MTLVDPRTAPRSDLLRLLALNNAAKVETSELDAARLQQLFGVAFLALATPDSTALLIAFDQAAEYDSPNFLWFRARYDRFVYVDRVIVAEAERGRGLARQLYMALSAAAQAAGHTRVVCEVNIDPPNPVSDAFHGALGFAEVGRGQLARGKAVRYLEYPITPRIRF